MKRLWAPWRMAYVGAGNPPSGCIFCEACSSKDDRASLVLHRGMLAYLVLNTFPYSPGHLMAVVNRHVGTLEQATAAEVAEAMQLVTRSTAALRTEYRAEGFNIGVNQGRVAGAGVADHLHIHVVPRWNGDASFMPVLGEVRVLPESLDATYARLRGALAG
ncbi:MAG: HIT domain-containing protein [Candidatus Rokubacteria bacterium]|nr:HIT domain-containing protein [Candidatus Rokubacteria bacterium]